MAQMYPETEETEDAKIGTATHDLGAVMVDAASRAGRKSRETIVGTLAPNQAVYDDEMYDGADLYASHCRELMRKTGNFNPNIEAHITAPRVHELSEGTTDFWLLDVNTWTLYLRDFKFGYGVIEAFENWQLINYAAGILDQLRAKGLTDEQITVDMGIVQPRAYHRDGPIRTWRVNGADLRPYVNTLEANAALALSGNGQCHSGPYCKNCSARHACDAALRGGVGLYEAAAAPLPLEVSAQALGFQLLIVRRALKQLEGLETAYTAQVEGLIRSGSNVPLWDAEPRYGRENWDKPPAEVIAMGEMMGHDLRKPNVVITPKQAVALGIDSTIIKAYSSTPRNGVKVVPQDTNRAKRAFS